MADIDSATDSVVANEPVAQPGPPASVADVPGSTPDPVDPTAPDAAEPDEAEKAKQAQSRKEARAFASLRRQIVERDREIGRLQGRSEAATPAQAPAAAGSPKQSSYNSFDDWQAAVVQHAVNEAVEKATKAVGAGDTERKTQEAGRTFWEKAAKEAKDKGIEGFAEAAQAIKDGEIPTTPFMSHYIIDVADNRAALVTWLADNHDEAERISKLDPVAAGAALAKVDDRIGRKPSAPKSNAPAPVSQVAGGGTVPSTVERMSHSDLTKLVGKWNRGR